MDGVRFYSGKSSAVSVGDGHFIPTLLPL